jgi:hypothetical protein
MDSRRIMFTEVPSSLYPLQPIGVGDALVQSMSSYVDRLAFEHSVFIFVLLVEQVFPLLNENPQETAESRSKLTANWFQNFSITINSLNKQTVLWSDIFTQLTQARDLKYLSLQSWHEVIPYRALLKDHFEWCPLCYSEMMEEREPIYNPLLWHVRSADFCIKHKRLLEDSCPYCSKRFMAISPKGCNGYCPYCSQWLGIPKAYSDDNRFSSNPSIYSDWVGDLLSIAPKLKKPPKREIIARTVKTYIQEFFDGNGALFARLLGLNHRTVYEWRDSTQIPQLNSLLRLCEKIGTTPLEFLTGQTLNNISSLPQPIIEDIPRKSSTTSYRHFDKEAIGQQLENVLNSDQTPPPSMSQVANSLNYDPSFLHKKLPQKTSRISLRFARFKKQNSEQSQITEERHLENTMVELDTTGIYSSHRRLRERFGGKMRNKRLRQARLRILQKLGTSR